MTRRLSIVLAALVAAAVPAAAQQASVVAAKVAAAPADGAVELRFPARAGVCGDGRSYIAVGRTTIRQGGYFDGDYRDADRAACVPGPVRTVLTLRGHDVTRVRVYAGGDSSARATDDARDLGAVDSRDAAAYLLDVASRTHSDQVADRAMLGAVLADRAVVWPGLLAIARDSSGARGRTGRSSAGFWLSRFAAAARDGHPDQLFGGDAMADEDSDDVDVRGKAVFALSQLPRHEGVPSLVQIARTHRDAGVRGKALFWLGQSDDPRALALFEEILRGSGDRR